MQYQIPVAWRELSSYQRDILHSLLVDGPATGAQLIERVGGTSRRQSKEPVYRHLETLEERGLARESDTQFDGRAVRHEVTDDGRALLWNAIHDGAQAMEDSHE